MNCGSPAKKTCCEKKHSMLLGISLISLQPAGERLCTRKQGEEEGGRQPANVDVQRRRHICRMRALFGNFLNGSACSQLQLQARRRSDTVRGGTIVCVCSLTASGQTYIMCCIWEWIKNTIKWKKASQYCCKEHKTHEALRVWARFKGVASRAQHRTGPFPID